MVQIPISTSTSTPFSFSSSSSSASTSTSTSTSTDPSAPPAPPGSSTSPPLNPHLNPNPQERTGRATRKERDSSTDTISTLIPNRSTFPELSSSTSPTALNQLQCNFEEEEENQPQLQLPDWLRPRDEAEMKREDSNSSGYYSPPTELQDADDMNPMNQSPSAHQRQAGDGSSLDRSSSLGSESVASSSSINNQYSYTSGSITSHSHSNSNTSDIGSNKLGRNLSTKSRTSSGDRIGSLKRSALKQQLSSLHSPNQSTSISNATSNYLLKQKKDLQPPASAADEYDGNYWPIGTNDSTFTSPDDHLEHGIEKSSPFDHSASSGGILSKTALDDLMERDRKLQEDYQLQTEGVAQTGDWKSAGPPSVSISRTQADSTEVPEARWMDNEIGEIVSEIGFHVGSNTKLSEHSLVQTPIRTRNSRSNSSASKDSSALSSPSTNKNLPLPPSRRQILPNSNSSATSLLSSSNRNKPLPQVITSPDSADTSTISTANQSRETLSAFSNTEGLPGYRAPAAPSIPTFSEQGSAWPSPDPSSESASPSNSGFKSAISRSGKALKKWTANAASTSLSPAHSPISRHSSRAPTPDPNESQHSIGDLNSSVDEGKQASLPPRSHSPFGFFRPQSRTSNRAPGPGLLKLTPVSGRKSSPGEIPASTGAFGRKQRFSKEKAPTRFEHDRSLKMSGLTSLSPSPSLARPSLAKQNSSGSTNTMSTENSASTAESRGSGSGGSSRSAWDRFNASTVKERGKRASHRLSMSLLEAASTPLMSPNSAALGLPSTSPKKQTAANSTLRASSQTPISTPSQIPTSTPARPTLTRNRSKSVDHLQRAYAGNRAQEEIEPVAIAAAEASQQARANSTGKESRRSALDGKRDLLASSDRSDGGLGLSVKNSRNLSGKSSIYSGRAGMDLDGTAKSTQGALTPEEVEKELGIVTKDSQYYSSLAASGSASGSGNTWSKKLHIRKPSGIPSLGIDVVRESSRISSGNPPDSAHNAKAAFSRMTSSLRSRRTSSHGGSRISGLNFQDATASSSDSGDVNSSSFAPRASTSSAKSSRGKASTEQPDSPGLQKLADAARLSSDLLALYDQEDQVGASFATSETQAVTPKEVDALLEGQEQGITVRAPAVSPSSRSSTKPTLRSPSRPTSRPPSVSKISHSRTTSLGRTLSSLFDPIQSKKSSVSPSPRSGSFGEDPNSQPSTPPSFSRPGTSLGFIRNIRRRSSVSSNADEVAKDEIQLQAQSPASLPVSPRSRLPILKAGASRSTITDSTTASTAGSKSNEGRSNVKSRSPKTSLSVAAQKQIKKASSQVSSSSTSSGQFRGTAASASPQRHPPSSYRGQGRASDVKANPRITSSTNGISSSSPAKDVTPDSIKSSGTSSTSARERATDYSKSKSKRSAASASASASPSSRKPVPAPTPNSRPMKIRSKSTPLNLVPGVSDTEDDPIPPRTSSRQGFHKSKSEGAMNTTSSTQKQKSRATIGDGSEGATGVSSARKRRGSDRAPLTLDTSVASTLPARPSTAQGMNRVGSIGRQHWTSDNPQQTSASAATTPERKLSHHALSIVDDVEFLKALEQVRTLHKQQMAKQEAETSRLERMAKLGMAPGGRRTHHNPHLTGDERGRPRQVTQGSAGMSPFESDQLRSARTKTRHARTSSADARLGGKSKNDASAEFGLSLPISSAKDNLLAGSSTPDAKATAITIREELAAEMGQAAGNEDDWKKEVKALFVIRELVQTELSYQRHLESLMNVVRAAVAPSSTHTSTHTSPVNARRKSGSGLSALTSANTPSKSASAVTPAVHIRTLRNLLPQLIALSRSLTSKIDENPTPSGVGTAFTVVSAQLEATFVSWSSQIDSVMSGLRTSEGSKGRLNRLGLIPILPAAGSEELNASQESSSLASVTPSDTRSTIDALSLTRLNSPIKSSTQEFGSSRWTAKRRSTISNADHYQHIVLSALVDSPTKSSVGNSNSEGKKQLPKSKSTVPSRSASPFGWTSGPSSQPSSLGKKTGVAYKTTNASRNRSNTPSTSISPQEGQSTLPSNGASRSNTNTNTNTKSLSPLDIAIMPTQRVPRYVLLLKDLVRNTPQRSISHAIVAKALDQLQVTAGLCDRASNMVDQPHLASTKSATNSSQKKWNAWA